MFWLILLIVVAALCALVLFLVAPAAGRKELRTPFAGRNFAHRGYFGKDQRPPENSLPAFAAASCIASSSPIIVTERSEKDFAASSAPITAASGALSPPITSTSIFISVNHSLSIRAISLFNK